MTQDSEQIKRFGSPNMQSSRWRRVVTTLDAFFGGEWRANSRLLGEPHEYLGDSAVTFLTTLNNRISALAKEKAEQSERLSRQAVTIEELQKQEADLKRASEVSVEFRRSKDLKWEGSYTKRVVDAVKAQFGYRRAMDRVRRRGIKSSVLDGINAALNLLQDYHATQHQVYERAEAAEKELKVLVQAHCTLQLELRSVRTGYEVLKRTHQNQQKTIAQLQEQLKTQQFVGAQLAHTQEAQSPTPVSGSGGSGCPGGTAGYPVGIASYSRSGTNHGKFTHWTYERAAVERKLACPNIAQAGNELERAFEKATCATGTGVTYFRDALANYVTAIALREVVAFQKDLP